MFLVLIVFLSTVLCFLFSLLALVLAQPVTRSSELLGGQVLQLCCEKIKINIYIDYQGKI